MNRWNDPFPRTPRGFHDRVEQTLGGLEEKDMKINRSYKRLTALLAAAIVALLATAAVAVSLGNARFKQVLTNGGAKEVAALVQEAHVAGTGDEADGFALSVDEIIWEDDQLYFTYTASVPDDGNRYLLALYTPLLNGEPMVFTSMGWEFSAFFDDKMQVVIPMGGKWPASNGQLLTFKVDPELRRKAANALYMRADFFKTDIDFTGEMSGFESRFKGAVPTVCLTFDATEYLEDYVERLALTPMQAEAQREIADAAGDDGILSAQELAATAHVETAARREVRMAMDASKLAQTVYDGVEETEHEINGCKLTVEGFHMTHLGASIDLRVTAPAGLSEEDGRRLIEEVISPKARGKRYFWCPFRPDGSELSLDQGWESGAGYQPLPDGTPSYAFGLDLEGIIPLDGLEKVILMPCCFENDADDNVHWDSMTDWAIELTPIVSRTQGDVEPVRTLSSDEQAAFDRAMNGEVMTRLERRIAAANWREGDPTVTVFAEESDRLFHVDVECAGADIAAPVAIEDAVKAGKLPCPQCVGGSKAPEEVDIMTGEVK